MLPSASFGWPLPFAEALKIACDLTFLAQFRHVRPPGLARAPLVRAVVRRFGLEVDPNVVSG